MTEIEEKTLNYLQKRKTASTTSQVAKKFNVTYQYAGMVLRGLVEKKLIVGVRAGGTKLYAYNHQGSSTSVRSASTKDGVLLPSQAGNKEPCSPA